MRDEAFIEQLRLCPLRPKGPLPRVSARLLELVEDHGAIEPVVVRRVGDSYEILGNVETWLAAQQVRLDRVPIHVLEGISDVDAADVVAAAFSGYRSNPIEEAEYFQSQVSTTQSGRLKHRAVTRLAYQTGHARAYISHSLRLLRLPQEIQRLVIAGRLSGGHARALVSVDSRSAQLALAKRVMEQQLSVRETEALAKELRDGTQSVPLAASESPESESLDPNIRKLENRISERLGCAASIDVESSQLTIGYYNLDILDGVLAKLGVVDV